MVATSGKKKKRKIFGSPTRAERESVTEKRRDRAEVADIDQSGLYVDDEYEDEDGEIGEAFEDVILSLGTPNTPLHVSLDEILKARLAIWANSGGGKSFLLRQLIEKVGRHTQVIIIDIEGEYASLRQAPSLRDILLVGDIEEDGADVQLHLHTAEILAHKLLELKQSVIIDVNTLSQLNKQQYIADFCNALVSAPRALWTSAFCVIDEVHVVAPARGTPPSKPALANLLSRARKRGIGVAIASQRLSKVDANTAAEAQTILIGRTRHDNDMLRSGDMLGLTKAGGKTLGQLKPGEFWIIGAAQEAVDEDGDEDSYKFRAGLPISKHPEVSRAGRRKIRRTKPSDATLEVIPIFDDLVNHVDTGEDLEDLDKAGMREMILGLRYSLSTALNACISCGHVPNGEVNDGDGIPKYGNEEELASSDDDEYDFNEDEGEEGNDKGTDVCEDCGQPDEECSCNCHDCDKPWEECVCLDEPEDGDEPETEEKSGEGDYEDVEVCGDCEKDLAECECECGECGKAFSACECPEEPE